MGRGGCDDVLADPSNEILDAVHIAESHKFALERETAEVIPGAMRAWIDGQPVTRGNASLTCFKFRILRRPDTAPAPLTPRLGTHQPHRRLHLENPTQHNYQQIQAPTAVPHSLTYFAIRFLQSPDGHDHHDRPRTSRPHKPQCHQRNPHRHPQPAHQTLETRPRTGLVGANQPGHGTSSSLAARRSRASCGPKGRPEPTDAPISTRRASKQTLPPRKSKLPGQLSAEQPVFPQPQHTQLRGCWCLWYP